jgi:proteasome accessory factor B
MAARRAERLVNLVLCLLSTRQFLTAEQIRGAVPGYELSDGTARADEAFHRMFERDKGELRELGVPLETGRNSYFDVDDGYRIARRNYELPPIEFTPQEATAVGLAIRLWQSAALGQAAHGALLKLRAAGVQLDQEPMPGSLPPVDASEPALPALLDAVRARQAVRFTYLKPGSRTSEARRVQPWGVVSWRGRWYLVGYDVGRSDTRSFRLSRVEGSVRPVGAVGAFERPAQVDLLTIVSARMPESDRRARVRLIGGRGEHLRRFSLQSGQAEQRQSAPAQADQLQSSQQQDEVEIQYRDLGWLARQVAAAGTGAVALEPPELVDAVVALLTAAAGQSARVSP